MIRFWRWLRNLPTFRGFYFEAAEGYQSWNPDPAELPALVKRVEEIMAGDSKRDKAE